MAKTHKAIKNERRRRFKAALALAGVTQSEWATGQGVTRDHLRFVLNGRVSGKLEREIDAFIAKYLPEQQQRAAV